jgi:hypothetical protein
MQGALRALMTVALAAGVVPAQASAQGLDLPQLPPVETPPVTLPPVQLPAPLPEVSVPPVAVPEVRVEVPQPALPQVPAVRVPQAPLSPPPAAPEPAAVLREGAGLPAGAGSGSAAAGSVTQSGQAPSGAGAAPAGTASAPPARSLAARVAALRAGPGVLGTTYRSPRQLVRALSACVAGLPGRQERLIVMRYGVGAAAAHPDHAVAGALGLSRTEYTTLRRRALRGIVRDARDGGCTDGAAVTAAPTLAFGDGGELRSVAAATRAGTAHSRVAEIAVRGERASGGAAPTDEDGGDLSTPLALNVDEPDGSSLGVLLLVAAMGVLAAIGLRGLRAAVRR